MSIAHRVAKLESAAGLDGTGCPQCRGRVQSVVVMPGDPEPTDVLCPACGRSVLTVVEIVFTQTDLPCYAPLEASRDE